MAIVRLFASAREAAGRGRDQLPGATVSDVLDAAVDRYGPDFAALLPTCRVWVNGEAVPEQTAVGPDDEVAVLPPVSGGATEPVAARHVPDPTSSRRPTPLTTEEDRRGR